MKILNIHSGTFKSGFFYGRDSVRDGAVKACIDTTTLINHDRTHHAFTLITPEDLAQCTHCDHSHFFTATKKEWGKSKKLLPALKDYFDLFIFHYISPGELKTIIAHKIPCIIIDHSMSSIKLKRFYDNVYGGPLQEATKDNKLVTVSATGLINKEMQLKRDGFDVKYHDWVNLQYVTEELSGPVQLHNGKGITIGRSNYAKLPHTIYRMRKYFDYQILTTYSASKSSSDKGCFDKFIGSNPEILERTIVDAPRNRIIDELSKSMIYVSTSRFESSGITAFEALCYGVPLLLYVAKPDQLHASSDFIKEGRGWVWETCWGTRNATSVNKTIKFIEHAKHIDRYKLASLMRDRYSIDNVAKTLVNKIEQWVK